MIAPLPPLLSVAGAVVTCSQIVTFNYIKIWEPGGLSSLRLRTGTRGLATERVQPYQLFQMQSPCQCSTQFHHTPNISSVSMALQYLSISVKPSSHSEAATGPEVLWTSMIATTTWQNTGSLSLPFALISVRTVKRPAKKQNLLVILFATKEPDNTRSEEFGVEGTVGETPHLLTCYHQRLPRKASPINIPPQGLCSHQKYYTRSSLVLFANPMGKENKIYKDGIAITILENEDSL